MYKMSSSKLNIRPYMPRDIGSPSTLKYLLCGQYAPLYAPHGIHRLYIYLVFKQKGKFTLKNW